MLSAAFALLFASASARVVNYTIDDGLGDQRTHRLPDYISNTVWKARSQADGCTSNCGLNIDLLQVHDGTWHGKETHADEKPSYVSLNFNGTKIYVFCVLANNIGIAAQDTRLSFYFDGASNPAGNFLHTADTKVDGFLYNQLVFASEALDSGPHTLVIKSSAEGDSGSLLVFDYALYSAEVEDDAPGANSINTSSVPSASTEPQTGDPTASQDEGNHQSHVGPIVGGSIAGVAVAGVLVALVLWLRSRWRRRAQPAWDFHASSARDMRHASAPTSTRAGVSSPPRSQSSSSTSRASDDDRPVLRGELESIREELARVRKIAEPPKYS